jgi:hypothetical protein
MRRALSWAPLVVFACVALAGCTRAPRKTPPPPNVVLIVIDTLRTLRYAE